MIPEIPEWVFNAMGFLAFIGLLALVSGAVWALVWVVRHIHFA